MPANRGDYMTLTPEDVLNKNFTPTQFRRGYDEREVDDFLDEVVAEMRRIVKDSDDLREQLNECRQSKGMTPVAKPDAGAEAKRAADAKEAEAKAEQEAQQRLAAITARADEAEKAAQERIAEATRRAEEAEKVAQARTAEAEQAAQEATSRLSGAQKDA